MKAVHFSVVIHPLQEASLAREIRLQASPAAWAAILRLSAEVVQEQERAVTGCQYLVAPVSPAFLEAVVRK